jgi:hypothetical protein
MEGVTNSAADTTAETTRERINAVLRVGMAVLRPWQGGSYRRERGCPFIGRRGPGLQRLSIPIFDVVFSPFDVAERDLRYISALRGA